MLSEHQGASEVISYITRYMVCGHCGQPYSAEDVRVELYKDGQWTLIATCPACHAEQPITAYDSPPYGQLRPAGVAAPAQVTQETVNEWADFLSGFTGDIYDLLANS
jgi:hypothetical protein